MTDASIWSALRQAQPCFWANPNRISHDAVHDKAQNDESRPMLPSEQQLQAARQRFARFAPLLAHLFPPLRESQGQITSPLIAVPALQDVLSFPRAHGQLMIKADHCLAVAGSVKARGGFHEILELSEKLADKHGLLGPNADVLDLATQRSRAVFSTYQVAVGSTGNLGMSIGLIAAALGFRATVHMSHDAKAWKKQRLRDNGVEVLEHSGDYALAVAAGRESARHDPQTHFVDDEQSLSLLLGYACAAFELQSQLQAQRIRVDAAHPLMVYIPCGVGGAPAGIAWGLDLVFGAHVRCYFAEPCQAPCFMLHMVSPAGTQPSVYDFGLQNRTIADGLAVAQASALAGALMQDRLAGCFTVADDTMLRHLALAHASEGLQLEPSATAGFDGPAWLAQTQQLHPDCTHVLWTTGGAVMPEAQFAQLLDQAATLPHHPSQP